MTVFERPRSPRLVSRLIRPRVAAHAVAGAVALSALTAAHPGAALASASATTPARLGAVSADGPAFDIDEYRAGDLAVQVLDAEGDPVDTTDRVLTYHWRVTPFGGQAWDGEPVQAADESNGRFEIALPFSTPDGTYALVASLAPGADQPAIEESVLDTFTIGQSSVVFPQPSVDADSGSAAAVDGRLVLGDGTPLPGRRVSLAFTPGTQYAPSGSSGAGNAALTSPDVATTSESGGFSAVVTDPPPPPGPFAAKASELGGRLSATGTWNANGADESTEVRFLITQGGPGTSVTVDYADGNAASVGPAGEVVRAVATVLSGTFGQPRPLPGVRVTLTLDHGFFLGEGQEPPRPGGFVGHARSAGSTISVVTGTDGRARVATTIGRDPDFDDDGLVDTRILASIGSGAPAQDNLTWAGAAPDRIGSIALRPVGATGPVPVGRGRDYDVVVRDEYGNRVSGVQYSIAPGDGTTILPLSDLDPDGDVNLTSDRPGQISFTATSVRATRTTYADDLTTLDTVRPSATVVVPFVAAGTAAGAGAGGSSSGATGGAAGAPRTDPGLRLRARTAGRTDVVLADARSAAAGARVVVYRVVGERRIRVGAGVLNVRGNLRVAAVDRNGTRRSAYRVVVTASARTTGVTRTVRVR